MTSTYSRAAAVPMQLREMLRSVYPRSPTRAPTTSEGDSSPRNARMVVVPVSHSGPSTTSPNSSRSEGDEELPLDATRDRSPTSSTADVDRICSITGKRVVPLGNAGVVETGPATAFEEVPKDAQRKPGLSPSRHSFSHWAYPRKPKARRRTIPVEAAEVSEHFP